jgi:uncharacterized protein YjbJ (UPF0337 family)
VKEEVREPPFREAGGRISLLRRRDMGFMDKLRNKFKMGKGRAKQDVGRATGDPYLESKGQAERIGGAGRQVGEQAKDAAKTTRDAVKN